MSRASFILLSVATSACSGLRSSVPAAGTTPSRRQVPIASETVVTYHPVATQIGYDTLHAGGNAFDAFIASTFAEYVLSEGQTSLGGLLGALVFDAKSKVSLYLDAGFNDPLNPQQSYDNTTSREGQTALVPGAVAGLEALSKRYGRLSFARVLEPAIKLAEGGFPLTDRYIDSIKGPFGAMLKKSAYGRRTYFANGEAPKTGSTLRLPEVAHFLKNLARDGSRYVYIGKWARECVAAVHAEGGHLDLADFSHYEAVWQTPFQSNYRGLDIYSPETHGGLIALLSLKVAERANLAQYGRHFSTSADAMDLLMRIYGVVAVQPWIYDDRKIHDEEFLSAQFSPGHIDELWRSVQLARAAEPPADRGTHSYQITIIDKEGNAVTGTNTIEGFPWGRGIFVEGIPLTSSNELTEFKTSPGARRKSGLSMHIGAQDQAVKFASGAFGMSLIPAEFEFMLNLIDYHMTAKDAAASPRLGVQAFDFPPPFKSRNGIWADPRIGQDVIDTLTKRNFKFVRSGFVDTGLGSLAVVDADGSVEGATAPLSGVRVVSDYIGIGIALGSDAQTNVVISSIVPGTSAAKSTVAIGDVVIGVQRYPESAYVPTTGMKPEEVTGIIHGTVDTNAILRIRKPSGEVSDVTLLRTEFSR